MKLVGIYCNKNLNNVTIFKDGFKSENETKQYMKQLNLNSDEYFVATVEV